MTNSKDTPPPPSSGKKRGRPAGTKNFRPDDPENENFFTTSIAYVLREDVDPHLFKEFWLMILADKNPAFEQDKKTGRWRVTESLNGPTPTLQQKIDAAKRVEDRRDGLPPQTHTIEAMIKTTIRPELPAELLAALNPNALPLLMQALALPPAGQSAADVIDAEIVSETPAVELKEVYQNPESASVELQEPGQVTEETK